MRIKNLKKAAERILKGIENQEKFVLFGDADLDGVCSLIILKETIETLGGKIAAIYFPDREKEGYGISLKALDFLKNFAPAIFISVDCGISNFEEIERAKELGFFTIIVDHHLVLDRLPSADIIVDPKQEGDKYPFKDLATAGLVFKLAQEILKEKLSEAMRRNFVELVALATLADMMPQEKENKVMIDEGLELMKISYRPAFSVLKLYFQIPKEIQKVISILNVRHVENNLPASFRFLTMQNEKDAKQLFEKLLEGAKERKEKIKQILEKFKAQIQQDDKIIFVGDKDLEFSLIPAIASQLCQEYQKITFVFKIGETETQGTVRAPKGINSVELMKKCKNLLISFGGHPQASGFKIKNENLEKFKKCLIENL